MGCSTSWWCHTCPDNLESSQDWWTWPTLLSQFPWVARGWGFFIFLIPVSGILQPWCIFLSQLHLRLLEVFKRSKTRQWIPWRLTAGVLTQHLNATTLQREREWRPEEQHMGDHTVRCTFCVSQDRQRGQESSHTPKMWQRGMRRDRQRQDGTKHCNWGQETWGAGRIPLV